MKEQAHHLHHLCLSKEATLSLAESLTGGSLAAALVSVPDASTYFAGSVVAYANRAKRDLLRVREETFIQFGAVSESCALEMAEGARALFDTTYALSVTGIAGPGGGSKEKPVGTVCFALATPDETVAWTEHFPGAREEVIGHTVHHSLDALIKRLS